MLRKKKPKRLYYPTKSRWYTRPRRRKSTVKRATVPYKKKVFNFLKDQPYFMVMAALMTVLFLFFSFSSYFMVTTIEVVRKNFNVDSARIENELKSHVGKNIFLLSKSTIHRQIQKIFPEFSTIRVYKKFPSTVTIDLESYPIVANLRAYYVLPEPDELDTEEFTELNRAIEDLSSSDPALAKSIDENPVEKAADSGAFDLEGTKPDEPEIQEQKALLNQLGQAIFDQEENLELLQISIHGLTQPIEDREQVIDPEYIQYILNTLKYFNNQQSNLEILALDYLPIPREIRLKTSKNMSLWMTLDRPYKDQLNKLETIYEPAELDKQDIVYIDLRIREKVIYCPKGARCDQ